MYCKRCGAQNSDESRYCVKCGGELAAQSQMEMASGSLGFEEGFTKALRTFGAGLLSDPMRLKSSVADECDHGTREYIVFERHCDPELLGPFVAAVEAGDASEVSRACTLATMYLHEQRAEERDTSRSVALGIANAVASVCGMGRIDIPADVTNDRQASGSASPANVMPVAPAQNATSSGQTQSVQQMTQQMPVQSPVQTPYDQSQVGQSGAGSKIPIIIGAIAAIATILVVAFVVVPRLNGSQQGSSTSQGVSGSAADAVSISFEGAAADGGTMSPLSCASGDTVTVPRCGFTRRGYSFDCWQSPDGTKYSPGDSIVPTKDLTLTAVWSAEECTVRFMGAGADGGSTESITTTSGASVTLPSCGFYRTGYQFDCWEAEDGSAHDPGSTITVQGDTSFAARWKSKAQDASSSSSSSSGTLSASTLPRSWKGSYEGYTTHTKDGVITRSVQLDFTTVGSDGRVQGVAKIGEIEMIEGATRGSYNFEGTLDFSTGAIDIHGTTWVDKGGLIGVGGFKGKVDSSNWTMSGEWYDPEGEADNGAWYMRAQ